MSEFNKWKESTSDAEKFTIKYYKGLGGSSKRSLRGGRGLFFPLLRLISGTSTSKEAREYFSSFDKHLVKFRHEDDEDDLRIRLMFDKRRSDDRKQWISERLEATSPQV